MAAIIGARRTCSSVLPSRERWFHSGTFYYYASERLGIFVKDSSNNRAGRDQQDARRLRTRLQVDRFLRWTRRLGAIAFGLVGGLIFALRIQKPDLLHDIAIRRNEPRF